jgi:cell division protein FtsZ
VNTEAVPAASSLSSSWGGSTGPSAASTPGPGIQGTGAGAASAGTGESAAAPGETVATPGYLGNGGAGYDPGAGYDTGSTSDRTIADSPAQPAAEFSAGYVPSAVTFVSEDEDDYGRTSYDTHPRDDRDRDPGGDGGAAWKDSGRPGMGKQDKVFDVTAGRRRPVVFEEEDDLDVPDFLK